MPSRRDREKVKARIAQARLWADETTEESLPSAFHPQFQNYFDLRKTKPISAAILHGRTSKAEQNVCLQIKAAKAVLKANGTKVVKSFAESGVKGHLDQAERPQLAAAYDLAKRLNLPVISPCFSRLLRNPTYHPCLNPEARPTEEQIERFLEFAEGITSIFLNDMDAAPAEDEVFLRKIIQDFQGRTVGRKPKKKTGYVKERRLKFKATAIAMRASGNTLTEIAKHVSLTSGFPLTPKAIWQWLR